METPRFVASCSEVGVAVAGEGNGGFGYVPLTCEVRATSG